MRELLKKRIVNGYHEGYDELGISSFNFYREKNGLELFVDNVINTGKFDEVNPAFDIHEFLNKLTDSELISIFDRQCCQRYR